MRKKFIAGNWKMHKNKTDALLYLKDFKLNVKNVTDTEIVLCVPSTLLSVVNEKVKDSNINLAAQNIHHEESGAFTGEICAKMVKDFVNYVVIGHSERRKYFNETNQILNKKVNLALKQSLKIIFCVGETLEQRDKNETKSIIETQIREGLAKTTVSDLINIVIAYEPVWAIGTGQTASPEQAQEIHGFIRQLIADLYNNESANNLRIIYGGSVNPKNAAEIISQPDIDGCLPGGASLDPESFAKIIKA
jgi:triosephosphate isomerase (TIM)